MMNQMNHLKAGKQRSRGDITDTYYRPHSDLIEISHVSLRVEVQALVLDGDHRSLDGVHYGCLSTSDRPPASQSEICHES